MDRIDVSAEAGSAIATSRPTTTTAITARDMATIRADSTAATAPRAIRNSDRPSAVFRVDDLGIDRLRQESLEPSRMRGCVRLKLAIGIAVLAVGVPAAADPVNSDLAAAQAGGGCYPTGIQPSLFDMLVL